MNKIRFIREYESYGHMWYDIVYHSGRVFTIPADEAPKTASAFISQATGTYGYDSVFKREEIVWQV